jgi:hypothetical protein
MTMTLEFRPENSCRPYHDLVIIAQIVGFRGMLL